MDIKELKDIEVTATSSTADGMGEKIELRKNSSFYIFTEEGVREIVRQGVVKAQKDTIINSIWFFSIGIIVGLILGNL